MSSRGGLVGLGKTDRKIMEVVRDVCVLVTKISVHIKSVRSEDEDWTLLE